MTNSGELNQRLQQLERRTKGLSYALAFWVIAFMTQLVGMFGTGYYVRRPFFSKTTAALQSVGDGSVGLYLWDSERNLRAELVVNADGSPRLVLFDENKKELFRAPQEEAIVALLTVATGLPMYRAAIDLWPVLSDPVIGFGRLQGWPSQACGVDA